MSCCSCGFLHSAGCPIHRILIHSVALSRRQARAAGRDGRSGTGGFFAPACTPGPSGFASASPSGWTTPAWPAAAFLTHPVSQDFTFQPVEHLHQHRRNTTPPTVFAAGLLKRIRQAAALRFRQLTGGGFNPDEWREAPRLDKSSGCGFCRSVLWSGGRRPSRTGCPLAVSVTAHPAC